MKGKYTMIICIGFTAMVLTLVMMTQFKTIDETDITAIETMRETELRAELTSWKDKYDEVQEKIADRKLKIEEYKNELNNNAETSNVLENEVKEAEAFLGYKALKGEGIEVTLKDTSERLVEYSDLLRIINELNLAGAEAIAINDERIVSVSEITLVKSRIILVNGNKVSGPYVIKAIGDKKYLESNLSIKGGILDELKTEYEKDVEYIVKDNVEIPAYNGELSFSKAAENNDNN